MNIFTSVTVLSSNGAGPAVDVSAFGATKTIAVYGTFSATVNIEICNELVPTQWAPLLTFLAADGETVNVAARWVRTRVTGYKHGAPTCDIGGTDYGSAFASLPAPVGNGSGAAVDVSTLALYKTVTVGGPFGGNVQVELSEDGITSWSQIGFGFSTPGQQSQLIAARFMRVVRSGVPSIAPGLPIVDVGGTSFCPPDPAIFAAYRTTSTGTELLVDDGTLVVRGAASPVTISLPAASGVLAGRRYAIKDGDGTSGSLPILISPSGTDTIDTESSAVIALAFGSIDICCDGVGAWHIL